MKRKDPFWRKIGGPAVFLAALVLGGCTYHMKLAARDLHSNTPAPAQPAGGKLPLKAALLMNPTNAQELRTGSCVPIIGWPRARIVIEPDFYQDAVLSALSDVFESVSLVSSDQEAADADLIVHLAAGFPEKLGFSVLDPASLDIEGSYEAKINISVCGDANGFFPLAFPVVFPQKDVITQCVSNFLFETVGWDRLIPLWMPFSQRRCYREFREDLALQIESSLAGMVAEAVQNERLIDRLPQQQAAAAEAAAAEQAEIQGDDEEALRLYAMAVKESVAIPHGKNRTAQKILEGYLRLVGKTGSVSELPPKAAKELDWADLILHDNSHLLGNPSRALAALRRAEALAPGNPIIYYDEGQVFEYLGQSQEAATAYRHYLLTSPAAPDAPAVEEKIRALDSSDAALKPVQLAWSCSSERAQAESFLVPEGMLRNLVSINWMRQCSTRNQRTYSTPQDELIRWTYILFPG